MQRSIGKESCINGACGWIAQMRPGRFNGVRLILRQRGGGRVDCGVLVGWGLGISPVRDAHFDIQ